MLPMYVPAEYRKSFHNQECQALQIQELKLEIATLKKEVFLTGKIKYDITGGVESRFGTLFVMFYN